MKPYHTPHRSLALAAGLCLVALAAGCQYLPSSKPKPGTPTPSQEAAVREVFEALKAKDLTRFHGGMITTADFIMRDSGLSDFHKQASYAGSVLKPQEQEQQAQDYNTATRGGSDYIDFSSATFESLGTAVRTDAVETSDGKKIPYTEWSIKIKTGGKTIDTKDLYPRFQVVEWDKGHKVLNLVLGQPSFGDSGDDSPDSSDDE